MDALTAACDLPVCYLLVSVVVKVLGKELRPSPGMWRCPEGHTHSAWGSFLPVAIHKLALVDAD